MGRGLVPVLGSRVDPRQPGLVPGHRPARPGGHHHPYPAPVAAARPGHGRAAAGVGAAGHRPGFRSAPPGRRADRGGRAAGGAGAGRPGRAGLRPVWVRPDIDPVSGLPAAVAVRTVRDALAAHPDACGVILGDPSYVGTTGDLAGHAQAAHEAGVPLIVDAAWAAYLGFHPELPQHAIAAGADAMVTSAHKTLPAYTQGALVLARTERLDVARLNRAFDATHTASPGGSIMASIDAARALLARDGERLCARLLRGVAAAREQLREVPGVGVLDGPGVDPAKLVVLLAGAGAHGGLVEADLIAAGMPVEMGDRDTVVPIVTMADDGPRIAAFTEVLIAAIERHRGRPRRSAATAAWSVWPQTVLAPREAFFARNQTVAASAAIGRISAELVAPYPPGVPVLAPGELITPAALAALREVAADGGRIAYAADPTLATFQVVAS